MRISLFLLTFADISHARLTVARFYETHLTKCHVFTSKTHIYSFSSNATVFQSFDCLLLCLAILCNTFVYGHGHQALRYSIYCGGQCSPASTATGAQWKPHSVQRQCTTARNMAWASGSVHFNRIFQAQDVVAVIKVGWYGQSAHTSFCCHGTPGGCATRCTIWSFGFPPDVCALLF